MMNSTDYAAQLNNEAIAALQKGDASRAASTLKTAVMLLMNEQEQVYRVASEMQVDQPPLDAIQSAPFHGIASSVAIDSNNDTLFVMYPRPFVISTAHSLANEAGFHQCIVVALYNFAFAFDTLILVKGNMPGINARAAAWRVNAIKLYRLCLQVAGSRSRNEVDKMGCVLAAASNNLGRLQQDFENTKDCLRMSLDIIGSENARRQMSPDDYELLFSNLAPFLCVKDCLLPVAPAA